MKKIQVYADEKRDEVVYNLISRLEKESEGKRGYVQDQLKERLKAFEMLSERLDTTDPMKVVISCIEGLYTNRDNHSTPKSEQIADDPIDQTHKLLGFAKVEESNFGLDD